MILLLLENSGNDQPYCEREDFAVITIPHGSFLRKLRLLVAQQAERRRGGSPCDCMENGAEARVLGVLKAILAVP